MDPLLELAMLVKAGQRDFERRTTEAMRPLGVTAAQAEALVVIGQAEPISLKELGQLLIAEAGHPSRLVERHVEAGFVERRSAAEDRRRVVLSLTPKGRRQRDRVLEQRKAVLDAGRVLIGDRDLEPLLALMRELAQYSAFAELLERRRRLDERESDAG